MLGKGVSVSLLRFLAQCFEFALEALRCNVFKVVHSYSTKKGGGFTRPQVIETIVRGERVKLRTECYRLAMLVLLAALFRLWIAAVPVLAYLKLRRSCMVCYL